MIEVLQKEKISFFSYKEIAYRKEELLLKIGVSIIKIILIKILLIRENDTSGEMSKERGIKESKMEKFLFHIFIMSCTGSLLYGMILLIQMLFCKNWKANWQFQFFRWNYLFFLIPFTIGFTFMEQENRVCLYHCIFNKIRLSYLLFGIWIFGICVRWILQLKKNTY